MMISPPATDSLLTPPEAARFLAVCEKSLWNVTVPRGPLACVRIGRSVRYDPKDLRAYIEAVREA